MSADRTTARAVVCLCLVAAAAGIARAARSPVAAPPRLASLPYRFDAWQGRDAAPLDEDTVAALGADVYVNREYRAGGTPVGLYVAYYAHQQPGASIHSPLNCLPGTGWEPIDVETRIVDTGGGATGAVRRMTVQKDDDRALVLYWYQIHGRMLASEVASRAYLLADALRARPADAALVRIVVPLGASIDAAERQGTTFLRAMLPKLRAVWS